MALAVNWTVSFEIPGGIQEESYSVQLQKATTTVGFHVSGDRRVMVEKEVQLYSAVDGRLMRRDKWFWEYDTIDSPPRKITHEVYADVWIPGVSRWGALADDLPMIMREESETEPFAPYAMWEHHLTTRVRTSGYIIYTEKPNDDGPTPDGKAALAKRGMTTTGQKGISVRSGKPLINAIQDNGIIELEDAPQRAVWFDPYRTESHFEVEQVSGVAAFSVTMDHYKPGSVQVDGPQFSQRPGFKWKFRLSLDRPKLKVVAKSKDNKPYLHCEISDGGAHISSFDGTVRTIRPDGYRVYRKKVADAPIPDTGDPILAYWEMPPPNTRGKFTSTLTTTDYQGAPTSPLPLQEAYIEPGDTAEPDYEPVEEVGTVLARSDGKPAVVIDRDVWPGARFEYSAVAFLGDSTSSPAEGVEVTHPLGSVGSAIVSYQVTGKKTGVGGAVEIDISPPRDVIFPDYMTGGAQVVDLPALVALPGDDLPADDGSMFDDEFVSGFGEDELDTFGPSFGWVSDLPPLGGGGSGLDGNPFQGGVDPYTLGEAIGRRVYGRDAQPRIQLQLQLVSPVFLLIVDRGQVVKIEASTWTTIANGMIVTSETIEKKWRVEGFDLRVSLDGGRGVNVSSSLTLEEL